MKEPEFKKGNVEVFNTPPTEIIGQLDQRGRLQIPDAYRRAYGMNPGDFVEVRIEGIYRTNK